MLQWLQYRGTKTHLVGHGPAFLQHVTQSTISKKTYNLKSVNTNKTFCSSDQYKYISFPGNFFTCLCKADLVGHRPLFYKALVGH